MELSRYSTILLDGDGVLWKGDEPLPGINLFFEFLRAQNIKWALLTNNNTRTAQDYINKIVNFGILADQYPVFTSSTTTAEYLLDRFGQGAKLHIVGMSGLIDTLAASGFQITIGDEEPTAQVAAVVAGMDREINHQKIKIAMRLILNGAAFVATNTDGSFPSPEGINPGTGMVIGALQFTTGVKPFVAGKPHPAIFETALKSLGSSMKDTLMVGDRLETDILGANLLGIPSAAVLSGVTSREEIKHSDIQPDYIFEGIPDLHEALAEVYQS